MGVLGAFFGCRGDGGFNGCCSGASIGDGGIMLACISGCRGVIGCIVATWLCPVREKVRPAWSDGGREREKVRPACSKCPEIGVLWRAGRTFSRLGMRGPVAGRTFSRKCRWKPRAGRVFSRVRLMERCARRSFLRLGMRRPVAGRSFSRAQQSRGLLGPCVAPRWRLRPAPRSRACHRY